VSATDTLPAGPLARSRQRHIEENVMAHATPAPSAAGIVAVARPRARIVTLFAAVALAVVASLALAGAAGAAPEPLWATQGGSALDDDRSNGVAALSDGSSIVTGEFRGTARLGPFTLQSAGESDIFVARMNADGTFAWATRAGGPGDDSGTGVSALPDGSSVITGDFTGGPVAFGASSLTSVGGTDIFVARVNADGTFAWAARAGGPTLDRGMAVSALPDGSAIVSGFFQGGPADFGGTSLTDQGGKDAFVARVNDNGTFAWATQVAGVMPSEATGVSALADGSSIVAGNFYGAATFGGIGGIERTSAGNGDAFVARVGANGAFTSVAQAGGTADDGATGVSALPDGAAIVTGFFYGTAAFAGAPDLTSVGGGDVFVARVNANGTFAWASRAGGASYEGGNAVSALADGSSVIAGDFYETAGFGPTTLTSAGNEDVFLARVNSDGSFAWAERAGGTSRDQAFAVSALAGGSMVVAGRFFGTAAFGPFSLSSPGTVDAFVARYVTEAPPAPTGVVVSLADGTAGVGFTPPPGGVAVSYAATCASSTGGETRGATGSASPLSVGGLTAGATYTCTVVATNPIGTSAASAPSAPFTVPAAQPPAVVAPLPARTTLGIRKTAPARALAGKRITYVIRVRNRGRVAARNVVLTDRLPAGLVFVRATPRATVRGRAVTMRLGRILPGKVRTVRITVRHTGAAGRKVNTAYAKASNSVRVRGVARTVFRSAAAPPA
jgi:uncharacterized repeat protein (TIGR01451 family)